MNNGYYPIMLKLTNQRVVVVGGGSIAARKVQGLLGSGANDVTVVAPLLNAELQQLAEEGKLTWVNDSYDRKFIQSAALVFAATDDKAINERISNDALACDILVCNVSDGEQGSFITPAIARHNGLTVAISSGGSSPSLIKHMKNELQQQYLPRYEQAQRLLERLRSDVLASELNSKQRQQLMELATADALAEAEITHSYEQWIEGLYSRTVQTEGEV